MKSIELVMLTSYNLLLFLYIFAIYSKSFQHVDSSFVPPTECANAIDRFRSQLKRAASFSALHRRNTNVEETELQEPKNLDCDNQEPKRGRIAFSSLLRIATEQAMMMPKRHKKSKQVDDTEEVYDSMPAQAKAFMESNIKPIRASYEDIQEQKERIRAKEISEYLDEAISSSHTAKISTGPVVPQRGTTRRLSYNQEYSKREEDRRQARSVAASLVRAQRPGVKRPTHTTQRKVTRRSSSIQRTKISSYSASAPTDQHHTTTRLPRRRPEIA
jgi:hypothetical protein